MKKYLPLLGVTLTGLLLRLWNLTNVSLWHDEAFSALLIKYPFGEMIYRIGLDVHPPLYYVFLRAWSVFFGNSLGSLRGFSVFFGVATILAGYAFVKATFKNEKAALITALLLAVNPFQVQYVSEARMYTMGAFFAIFGALALVKAFAYEKLNAKAWMWYFLFALSCAIMILTHYYLLFTAAALCLYALANRAWYYKLQVKKYIPLLLSYAFIAGSFLLYIKTFLFQYGQVGGGYWIPPIDRWSIPTTLWTQLIGIGVDINKQRTQVLVSLATIAVVSLIIYFLKKTKEESKWLTVLAFLAPFGGSILFALLSYLKGSNSSVYLVRYFLYSATFLSIMLGVWFVKIGRPLPRRILLSAYTLLCLISVWHFWDDLKPNERPGMDAAAKYLKANVEAGDRIIIGSSFEFFNYKYYNSLRKTATGVTPKLFSGGTTEVHSLPHYAGTAILTNDDLAPDFTKEASRGDTVWLLWTNGFGGSKPEVPKNFTEIGEEKSYPEIRPYVGTYIYVTQYKVN